MRSLRSIMILRMDVAERIRNWYVCVIGDKSNSRDAFNRQFVIGFRPLVYASNIIYLIVSHGLNSSFTYIILVPNSLLCMYNVIRNGFGSCVPLVYTEQCR